MKRFLLAAALLFLAAPCFAQETQFGADLRLERKDIGDACDSINLKALGTCVYTLATATPFHIAFGSLAPQNGFAFGLAFNEHYTPNESWRLAWNADAVASSSGSWRAGAYMKLVRTPATSGVVVRRPGDPPAAGTIAPREFSVIDLFAQTISLDTINSFGPGASSLESAREEFSERETLVGTAVTYPLGIRALGALRPALLGGVLGRFITTSSVQPALADKRGFLETREGLRLRPSLGTGLVQLNYVLSAQQFTAKAASHSSFRRWTLDLQHEIPFYRTVSSSGPRDFNGPDACASGVTSSSCDPVQWSRNREGSLNLRLLVVASTTGRDGRVPAYLQPTLGGSDLNGQSMLASYADYRFRANDMLLLQQTVEHSIWGPIGAFVLVEEGKVADAASDLGFTGLRSSATVGLTVRAGGFPMVKLSFAWGGEGHHIAGVMDTTLLGGSSRPSLF